MAGSPERVSTIDVRGLSVPVIGVEDLILDRLRAAAHWRSQADEEWAARLVALHDHSLDWPYLEAQAAAERLAGTLEKVRKRAHRWTARQGPQPGKD
ncbi:hypothetical protein [Limnochorda pilosa]|uniref:Uncharacterized protein n=1 Tax=Limnochorda pilosa TaxID=1555112 RepID=A0A0K2SH66_LIMPI|nr:hypothetical protein [Limnochorda pilosa]BAS26463.1 hypothetical protein LIP_0606 [Limnochorda pilosa]